MAHYFHFISQVVMGFSMFYGIANRGSQLSHSYSVANLGEGTEPTLFLGQTEALKTEDRQTDRQTDRHVFIWGLIQRKYIDYNSK